MAISPTGSVSMSQINTEFGLGLNLNAYRGTTYYTSSAGPFTFPAGTISMNNFRGTQANNPSGFTSFGLSTIPSNTFAYYTGDFNIDLGLRLLSDGSWETYDDTGITNNGNWGNPTTPGAGSNYWVRFTRTAYTPIGSPELSTATTGWLNLGTNQTVQAVTTFSAISSTSATYNIQIATDSSGTNIVDSATNKRIIAVPGEPP